MCEMACQIIQKKQKEKRIEEEQAAKAQNSMIPVCYDDDDDYSAIIPNEPVDSLSMGDEHLNTIPATESDELIKSCVENLVPNPKIFSNPLFEEEIISTNIDPHHFDAESDLIESLLNRDSSIISSSSKIDSLLDELAGELTLLKSIPLGIDGTDCHPENEIRFTERLLYDNSSPCLPKEFVYENSDADIESFSPSPIPNKDSDSFMEEIDLFLTPDDPMPPGIEEDDDDSEKDILILEELPINYSLSLLEIETFYFDIPSFSCPPAKPPDVIQYSWKFEDSCQRILSSKSSFPQLQLGIHMGDEHLDTILATESDELIKSCVENLVPNLISLLNRDSSIISSSSKIDFLLDELPGKLTLLKSISPGIDGTDCHPENEIRFTERLLYDNSSPRPPKEFVYENSDGDIESFSPSPIPNKDSDSFMKEIDLFLTPDDPMPHGIEEDDDDSERDILILE
nr:hypothetical protein [Tanacetum cinerariifolium]